MNAPHRLGPQNLLTYSGDYFSLRYCRLSEVNRQNVNWVHPFHALEKIENTRFVGTSCRRPPSGARVLDLRILPGSATQMNNLRHPPLGHSIADQTGGVYATVFFESVRREASAANVPWTVILAYAAAHELGHLLLGSDAHSSRGVMKGSWDAKDMQLMFQKAVHFNPVWSGNWNCLDSCSSLACVSRENELT
jgi:hypothetical protein